MTFSKNGKIYTKAHYKMGIFVDSFHLYYDNGQLRSESWFDSTGIPQGIFKLYHENGQLFEIGRDIDGKPVDMIIGYDTDGKLEFLDYYKPSSLDRVVTYFNRTGNITKIEYYHGDTKIREQYPNSR